MNSREEIENELALLGSKLAGGRIQNSPAIPEDYFTKLEVQVMAEFIIHEKFRREQLPYPKGYLTELPDKILDNYFTTKSSPKEFSLRFLSINNVFRAAAAVTFIVLSVMLLTETSIRKTNVQPEFSLDESLYFIENHMEEFELEDLAVYGALEEEDLSIVDHDENLLNILGDSYMEFPDLYLEVH